MASGTMLFRRGWMRAETLFRLTRRWPEHLISRLAVLTIYQKMCLLELSLRDAKLCLDFVFAPEEDLARQRSQIHL